MSSRLGGAQYALQIQGVEVLALGACMTGVSNALVQIGLADEAGAAGSLASVSGNCVLAEGAVAVLAGGV